MRITGIESFTTHLPVAQEDKVRGIYGDGTFTAIAQTAHLSPLEVSAPGLGTPIPQLFIPDARAG